MCLEPIGAASNPTEVADFRRVYPEPDNNFPFDQRVVVSAKNAPERFFNENNLHHEVININTPDQEVKLDGVSFRYIDRDRLKPNNIDQYVGFQEIYGRQDIGNLDARPPTTLTIEKEKPTIFLLTKGL